MDRRLKHPFPAIVAGRTCYGESKFVKRLLESGKDLIDGAPGNVIWCYGIYQPAYDDMLGMLTTTPNINFVEGVPSNLESLIDPSTRNLVVIDNLMQELSNDQRITTAIAMTLFFSKVLTEKLIFEKSITLHKVHFVRCFSIPACHWKCHKHLKSHK